MYYKDGKRGLKFINWKVASSSPINDNKLTEINSFLNDNFN